PKVYEAREGENWALSRASRVAWKGGGPCVSPEQSLRLFLVACGARERVGSWLPQLLGACRVEELQGVAVCQPRSCHLPPVGVGRCRCFVSLGSGSAVHIGLDDPLQPFAVCTAGWVCLRCFRNVGQRG